jgi:hypothetical protein
MKVLVVLGDYEDHVCINDIKSNPTSDKYNKSLYQKIDD